MIVVWWNGRGPIALIGFWLVAIALAVTGYLAEPSMKRWLMPLVAGVVLTAWGHACIRFNAKWTKDDPLAKWHGSLMDFIEYYPHALFSIPLPWWGYFFKIAGLLIACIPIFI